MDGIKLILFNKTLHSIIFHVTEYKSLHIETMEND